MISARRAALLGLTVPLSAIMTAVLGLWPEPEDEDDTPPQFDIGSGIGLGGGGKPVRKTLAKKRPAQEDDDDFLDHQRRMFERNRAAIAAIIAVVEAEGML